MRKSAAGGEGADTAAPEATPKSAKGRKTKTSKVVSQSDDDEVETPVKASKKRGTPKRAKSAAPEVSDGKLVMYLIRHRS